MVISFVQLLLQIMEKLICKNESEPFDFET